jgi:very-short-patch-repair endonuclease
MGEGEGGGDLGLIKDITQTAETLRKRLTDTERLLWTYLRAKQLEGFKFRRQEAIGRYIADFVCHEKRIIIEVDGGQHSTNKDRDKKRDNWFNEQGYTVLRFWNNEVLTNISGVLDVIRENCLSHPPLNPLPSREGKVVGGAPIKGGE